MVDEFKHKWNTTFCRNSDLTLNRRKLKIKSEFEGLAIWLKIEDQVNSGCIRGRPYKLTDFWPNFKIFPDFSRDKKFLDQVFQIGRHPGKHVTQYFLH